MSGQRGLARLARGVGEVPPVLAVLVVLTCLPELVLVGADLGLWGSPVWRTLAYGYGGFWAGLLGGWQANYPAQPAAMFVTHGFLHADLAHLIGNMLTLVPLGAVVTRWLGPARFLAAYAVGMLGGGLAYGLLSAGVAPMVGASGAIFGLAGALVVQDWLARRGPARTLAALGGLAGLNLAMWALMAGQVAWQAHLGGGLAGAAAALALRPGGPPPGSASPENQPVLPPSVERRPSPTGG